MSFNKIIVIGNLGRDPELRYTPQGDAVCDFSIAVNDRKRDKTGEYQDVTTWFKVTLWRKLAENASKYLTRGKSVYVEGRLQVILGRNQRLRKPYQYIKKQLYLEYAIWRGDFQHYFNSKRYSCNIAR